MIRNKASFKRIVAIVEHFFALKNKSQRDNHRHFKKHGHGLFIGMFLLILFSQRASAQMRITEWMYSGTAISGTSEFIEFTNVGTTTIDMTGWSSDDATRTPGAHSLSAAGIVQPGESVILTEADPAAFRTAWGLCAGKKVIGPYTNDNLSRADEINLYDATNTLIDRLTYDDQGSGNVKGPRTQNISGWAPATAMTTSSLSNTINNASVWLLSSTSNGAESSITLTSSGGDKGSSGKSTRATVTYDPCATGIAVTLSVSTNAALETGATVVTVTATAASAVSGAKTVSLGVSGTGITAGDYSLSSTTITIPSGGTTGSVTFTIVDDAAIEGAEVAGLTITNPSSGITTKTAATQFITITDNDGNNAPAIVMNVSTTTDYIDGGAVSAPASPFSLSGVISDPTDPSRTLGIDFTVSDLETASGSLTITKSSSNTSVVTNANLSVTGSGATRNLKITPTGVGYTTITITVSDGSLSASYILNYAASATAATPANTRWHTGISDASESIVLDDDYYVTGDDELNVLKVYSRTNSGTFLKSYAFDGVNLGTTLEVDLEAATKSINVANRVYWLGSMSNGKDPFASKPERDRIFATTITGTGASTSFLAVGTYGQLRSSLISWGDANGYNFTASAASGKDSKVIDGFAAEGMVFAPNGTTLYIGMRAPLVPTGNRTKAVIAPITNFEIWFNNGSPSGSPTYGSPIELNLGGKGIRDITKLSNGTYIIIAGPYDEGVSGAIYKWTGNASDAPIAVTSSAISSLKAEGVMQVNEGGILSMTKLQVVTDKGGDVVYNDGNEQKDLASSIRKFRLDDLSSLDLSMYTGTTASITAGSSTTFCQGGSVSLTASAGVSYLWSVGATTQVINVTSAGSYSVTVTYANGCSATSGNTIVTVNSLPTATITAGGSTTFCQGGFVLLSSNAGTGYLWSNGQTTQMINASASGSYNVRVTNVNGCSATSANTVVTVNNCSALSLKLFIQGYYRNIGSTTPMDNLGVGGCLNVTGGSANANDVDHVTVHLMNSSSPYSEVASATGVLQTNGMLNVIFIPGISGNYYLKITHRNSVETWCKNPLTLSFSNSYDFSNAANKAYGDNEVEVEPGVWAIYSGDINDGISSGSHNGVIESTDYADEENALNLSSSGYVVSDLTGDSDVNSDDYSLMQTNVYYTVISVHP